MGGNECIFCGHGSDYHFRYHVKEDKNVRRRSGPLCYGAPGLSYAHGRQCPALHVGTRMVLYQEGGYDYSAFYHRYLVYDLFWVYFGRIQDARRRGNGSVTPCGDRRCNRMDFYTAGLGKLAGGGGIHHRSCGEGKYCRHNGYSLSRRLA